MTFLNQALLFGLFAAAIPIIIHLMNRRRFRRVPWAAMRFLNVSVEQNQRRMKLEDLILLILRCALLALLALALARPVAEGLKGLPGSKVAAAVVVDTSASMGTEEGEETRLERARAAAKAVVEGLPAGSSAAILTPFRPDQPTTDKDLARRRIEDADQTDRHGDLLLALEEAARALEGQAAAEKEIYLITDGQAEEWSSFSALDDKLREFAAGTSVHLVLVGNPIESNLGISRLVPSGALPAVDQPFRIDVDVTNHGSTPARDVPVTLLVDNQPLDEPWLIDEIQPGRTESATLYATLPSAGYHRVTVALPGDRARYDDRRTLVLRAVDDVRILLVDGEPGAEERESETFFLRHALAPVTPERRDSYPVKPTVMPVSGLPGADLASFDAVVLANVADLPLPVTERLADYVDAGGGMMIFPGPNVRAEFYNTMLHTRHGLLPATLVPEQPDEGGAVRTLVPAETNPLGLDRRMLATATIRQAIALGDPTDPSSSPPSTSSRSTSSGTGRIAVRFSDGSPALLESEHGLGKVFTFATTIDTSWNDLAVKPAFVPLVNRLLGRIVQHRDAALNIRAGDVLTSRVDPILAGKEVTVSEVDSPEALGQLTQITDEAGGAVLRFEGTHRAGAYQAAIEGQPAPIVFAARPSLRESQLEVLAPEQVSRLSDSAEVIRWNAGSGLAEFGKGRTGSELWLPLLILVIAIAAVEIALAQWFSRPK